MSAQIRFDGEEFVTPRERASKAKASSQVVKTARTTAKALRAAGDALNEFRLACMDADMPMRGVDDTRVRLAEDMREYAGFLEAKYK